MAVAQGSISDSLDADFYGSSAGVVSADDLNAFNVAIDGHQYLTDVKQYQRAILEDQAAQVDDGSEPGLKSLSRAGFWSIQHDDWRDGAGQDLYDAADSSRSRFESSVGVDIWTPHRLSLLHDTALRHSSANTNIDVFAVGGFLYVVDGTFLRFTNNPDVTTPTFTSVNHTNTIIDATTDGARIYTVFGGAVVPNVATVGSAAAPAAFGATTPDIIEYANGRLLAADGGTLFELDNAGAKVSGTNIHVDGRANFAWTSISGSPGAIFAAGNAGDVGEIYSIGIDDVSTALTAPTYAAGLPYGETVNVVAAYPPGRLVAIGTSLGLRIATIAQRSLEVGELIEIPGGVNAITFRGRFGWFTWSNVRVGTTGIGRVDLARSTGETFVPPYAEDLAAAVTGTVSGVAALKGSGSTRERRYFAVVGSGVWGETDNLVAQGTIESGDIRFGVIPDKVFTGLDVHHDPSAGSIGAAITYDDGTSIFLGGNSAAGGTRMTLGAGDGPGLSASVALLLTRDEVDPETGPVVRAWVLHAVPRPKRVTEIVIAVLLRTTIVDLTNQEHVLDTLEEYRRLEDLASTSRLVIYQEGDEARKVRVASVAIPENGVRSWTDGPVTWYQATALVHMLSKES